MGFDDEQIADEKSIANMKVKYAGLDTNFVKSFAVSKNPEEFLELGKLIKKADKFFEFEKQKHFGEIVDFFDELKRVNLLELNELKKAYSEFDDLDKQTPQIIMNPQNLEEVNQNLARNELFAIQKLLKIYSDETNSENKKLLEKMIFRRLDSFIVMFL